MSLRELRDARAVARKPGAYPGIEREMDVAEAHAELEAAREVDRIIAERTACVIARRWR